ncbi:ABC transporter substrate-binding protein [Stomatohabitans albus]|uniref:peptide ABC transporter substrate-binding protein n=1 Tax=Stomatohabitans albus TaxID=3110766 RepID=UPI00300D77FA
MSKFRLSSALLLSLAMLAAGCSSNPSGGSSEGASDAGSSSNSSSEVATGETGGTLNVYACEPQVLVPSNTNESCGSEILSALFTPLVRIDEDKKPVFGDNQPDTVAKDIKLSDDKLVYTITLKDGFTFHNGEKLDAEAYVRAWNYGANPDNAQNNSAFYDKIAGYQEVQDKAATELSGLKAVDDKTLEVTLSAPFSPFISSLAYTAFYPMPKAGADDVKAYNEAPIGNGPFKMDGEWKHNQSITAVVNADYPGTKPSFSTLNFQIYSDIGTAYNELRAGNLDVVEDLPPEQQASFESDLGENLVVTPSSTFGFLGVPVNVEGLKDKRIRQALSLAIDRDALNKAVWNDTRTPADDYVAQPIDGYREGACTYCTYDPERAKQLFEEAGGYDGTLEVWFNSGAGHEEWIEAIANSWKQNLGISEVKFQSMIFAEFLNKLEEKNVSGPYRLGWSADYPSMDNYLAPILGTDGSSNYTGYSNPEFDNLIKQGNEAATREEAVKFYQQADDLVLEDMPLIPIVYSKKFSGISDNVDDFKVDFYDHVEYVNIKPKQN